MNYILKNSIGSENMNDLNRFIEAQKDSYHQALKEIKNGRKVTHWMWYIFPQIKGLGHSYMANYYALSSFNEAKQYYDNPILKSRLLEITKALLALKTDNPVMVMGYPDNLKLKSSMTLFYLVSKNDIFKQVLDKYYQGELDHKTITIINSD